MNEEQRWKAVKAHIAKGDQAKGKADQHYISAGQHLRALKEEHTGTWQEWEFKVKERAGIGKSRASELMQIADGTKTAESVAADRRERQRKAKEITKQKSSVDDGETKQPKPKGGASQDQHELQAKQAHIDELEAAREHDQTPAEKLRAAEIKIAALESEVEELKTENAKLREQLEAATARTVPGNGTAQADPTADRWIESSTL